MSPEILERRAVHYSTDIFSLGVLLYLLCEKSLPFTSMISTVKTEYAQIASTHYSAQLRRLVTNCLQREPKKRPTIQQILLNPLFEPYVQHHDFIYVSIPRIFKNLLLTVNLLNEEEKKDELDAQELHQFDDFMNKQENFDFPNLKISRRRRIQFTF